MEILSKSQCLKTCPDVVHKVIHTALWITLFLFAFFLGRHQGRRGSHQNPVDNFVDNVWITLSTRHCGQVCGQPPFFCGQPVDNMWTNRALKKEAFKLSTTADGLSTRCPQAVHTLSTRSPTGTELFDVVVLQEQLFSGQTVIHNLTLHLPLLLFLFKRFQILSSEKKKGGRRLPGSGESLLVRKATMGYSNRRLFFGTGCKR